MVSASSAPLLRGFSSHRKSLEEDYPLARLILPPIFAVNSVMISLIYKPSSSKIGLVLVLCDHRVQISLLQLLLVCPIAKEIRRNDHRFLLIFVAIMVFPQEYPGYWV